MLEINQVSKDGDPRVAEALDALGISYEIDSEGDFLVLFELENGRTQRGCIESDTDELMGKEVRAIYSIGLSSDGVFDARTANLLLQENANLLAGAWSVNNDADDNHFAIFTINVAADLKGEEMEEAMLAVIGVADNMEQRLSGRDDF